MTEIDNKIPILFTSKEKCCGCGACLNVCPRSAISMREDEGGFIYPIINSDLCIKCNKCITVCNFQLSKIKNKPIDVYVAVTKDKNILMKSASGGVFATLAKHFLKLGGFVVGAVMEKNFTVHHIIIDNISAVERLQGSKYAQSDIGSIYSKVKQQLYTGNTVLFSGTPCQIDGLYGYLGEKPDKLFTVDIVCHGVPSNRMLKEYLISLGINGSKNEMSFTFRDKTIGWGINGSMVFDGYKKKVYESESSYLYYFSKGWLYRDSCYNCKYACENRPGDITLGDYWGIERVHPEYLGENGFDESKGISAVIVNTERGYQIFNELDIQKKKSSFESVSKYNGQLISPSLKGERDEILNLYVERGWKAVENKFKSSIGLRYYSSRVKSWLPIEVKRWIKKYKKR